MAQATTPVVGTEKLGWDQDAANTTDLAALHWLVYVDQLAPVPVMNATCEQTRGAAGFPCRGDVPAMTPGDHSIVLTAYYDVGSTRLESLKSVPLPVRMIVAPAAPINPTIIRGSPGD